MRFARGPSRARARWALLTCALACAVGGTAPALGAERLYWGNRDANTISYVDLDSQIGADLTITQVLVRAPSGEAIDTAAGRIYWANQGNNTISSANLDGSGGRDLNTASATVDQPTGVAIDPAAGRIYWANAQANTISYARLDGSGGGDLDTAGAPVATPMGVAIDPAAGRIYWSNVSNIGLGSIGFARLDGTGGGGALNTTGATVARPSGLAIDPVLGRVYWANTGFGNSPAPGIAFANLSGTGGGGDLTVAGATVIGPLGVAIDQPAGRVYWASSPGDVISFARLDGTGGSGLPTAPATMDNPAFPVLLTSPQGTGAPAISGALTAGSALSCSPGSWAGDVLGAFLYRAPTTFAYSWTRDGVDIPGATAAALTTTAAGGYQCRVTAANAAGSATQISGPAFVAAAPAPAGGGAPAGGAPAGGAAPGTTTPSFGARLLVTLALRRTRVLADGPLGITVANANAFAVKGTLSGTTVRRFRTPRLRRIGLPSRTFRVTANVTKTVNLTLPIALRRVLRREGRLRVRITARVTDPAGHARTVTRTVTFALRT